MSYVHFPKGLPRPLCLDLLEMLSSSGDIAQRRGILCCIRGHDDHDQRVWRELVDEGAESGGA